MTAQQRGYENFDGFASEFTSDSRPWWPLAATPRRPHPNVVVILVDDLGFSDLGAFGSEIETPRTDTLARAGWTFTNYHTAPMCSPSRAALMTGLNPHRAGFGYVAHLDPGYPGYSCQLPVGAPTVAESLRAGGYATFMVGKWHLTIDSQLHDGADKSSWPLQRGFDRYYGCMDAFTSLHHPHRLVRDNSVVEVEEFPPGYFLTDDLTDRAIGMIEDLRANDDAKPFFLYFAHTAVHGPIQAKPVDVEKYRGRYAAGWTEIREARFARQKSLGIIDAVAVLPGDDLPDAAAIPDWESLSNDERELFARHMEAYAAAVDEIDQSVGRIVDRLTELGEIDNTVILITSDNGGSAEGGASGTRSYFAQFGATFTLPESWVHDVPRDPDLIGGPRVFSHYPAGWARVSNTPFRSFKSSTYEGGVHAPLILSWPGAPDSCSPGLRDQFVFVADLAPTILELAGVPRGGPDDAPELDGRSFSAALRNESAPGRARQYFECAGSRALYAEGWKAVAPFSPGKDSGGAGGPWELYDLVSDPTESHDLAPGHFEVVRALAEEWREQAWHNAVFPLDDDGGLHHVRPSTEEYLSASVDLIPYRPPLERYRAAKLTVLRSFRIDAELDLRAQDVGVIVAHGDQGGGYSLTTERSRLHLAYNAYGHMHRAVTAPFVKGIHRVVVRFDEEPGLRWSLTVEVDGRVAAALGPVPMLIGMAPFTGISVGYDYGGPVDWERYERHGPSRVRDGAIISLRYVPGERSPHDPTVIRHIGEFVANIAD